MKDNFHANSRQNSRKNHVIEMREIKKVHVWWANHQIANCTVSGCPCSLKLNGCKQSNTWWFIIQVNLELVHLPVHVHVQKHCWMSEKQCRPWLDAKFCSIWVYNVRSGLSVQKLKVWYTLLVLHRIAERQLQWIPTSKFRCKGNKRLPQVAKVPSHKWKGQISRGQELIFLIMTSSHAGEVL